MKKNNKIKKSVSVLAFLFVCTVSVILSSCSDELDIQQSYPFKVETMPVPKDIVRGQTVEIRCELKAEGKFDGTIYTIRYFQHDGKGSLRMENGTVFQPNDRYLLENEKFRLYYTSASTETQTLTVVVEDNFGKSYEMEFSFNDTDEEEEFARSANKLALSPLASGQTSCPTQEARLTISSASYATEFVDTSRKLFLLISIVETELHFV